MKKYDVIVVGGGFAGVAAAIASARDGAKTLLVEKGNALGGAAVNSLVMPFMPFTTEINGEKVELSQGIFKKICSLLKERNAYDIRKFSEEELKYILQELLTDFGVEILYHSYLHSVQKVDGKITSLTFSTVNGAIELEADYFIDTTGDAQLAFLAGCPVVVGREKDNLCQPMTLCFRVGNVDVDKVYSQYSLMQEKYKENLAKGKFINPREDVLVFKTTTPNVLHFNTTRVVKKNPVNVFEKTEAELIARKQVFEVYKFLKENIEGMENSFLMSTAQEIGVRESRMIIGDYVLTEQDCRNFTKFDDGIAVCNYDIDIHNPEGSGTSHYYFPKGEYYTIPYRSLIPKTVDNLLVAGRCISSDHGAQASYRIMPTVCNIGEAAGTAIAQAVKNKTSVREIDTKKLRETLLSYGAFLG